MTFLCGKMKWRELVSRALINVEARFYSGEKVS
jgi:hypothetical protein